MVVISETSRMFWGVTLDGGKRYTQTVETAFHISMAALEPAKANDKDKLVSLMVQTEQAEFMLCTLEQGKTYQVHLDLNFVEGEEVTFFLKGKGLVHLTGYLVPEDMDESAYANMMEGEESEDISEEEDSDEEDSDEEVPQLKAIEAGSKRKMKTAAAASKKQKIDTTIEDLDSDDDDEDDDDFDSFIDGEAEESDDEDSEEMSDDFDEMDDDLDDSEDEEDEVEEIPVKQSKKKETPKKDKTPTKDNKQTPNSKKADKTPNKKQNGETPKSKKAETPKQNGAPTPTGESTGKKKKKNKNKDKAEQETPNAKNKSAPNSPASEKKTPKKSVIEGGVIVEELKEGHGPPAKPGKMVHVYYTGRLKSNNKCFDSNTFGKPFKFKLGMGEVIKGWDKGLKGMKVGGKRKLVIPPQQAYGSQNMGDIPPNSTLVFDVELKNVS